MNPVQHVLGKITGLHMTALDKMRLPCGIFFRDGKVRMLSSKRNGFIAVFLALDIFLHNGLVFKGLSYRIPDCLLQIFKIRDLCDGAAPRPVCWFYHYRKLQPI